MTLALQIVLGLAFIVWVAVVVIMMISRVARTNGAFTGRTWQEARGDAWLCCQMTIISLMLGMRIMVYAYAFFTCVDGGYSLGRQMAESRNPPPPGPPTTG